jgi:hypothetical protein
MNGSSRDGLKTIYGSKSTRQGVDFEINQLSTFCMPLISGVVGTLAERMLCLSLCDDIRLEITLESLAASVVANNVLRANWSIVSWDLELSILELLLFFIISSIVFWFS